MHISKAVLVSMFSIGTLAATCGVSNVASAQNYTLPANTNIRALEAPVNVRPYQLRAQSARPNQARGVSRGFQAFAPDYYHPDER